MFTVRLKGLDDAIADLKRFREQAIPYAIREALNVSAHATAMRWEQTMERELTLRNQWTKRSIRVEHAKGKDPRNMVAKVGSLADYMDTTESGGTVSGKAKHKGIPQPAAAGQRGKRTKTVRRANLMQAIQVTPPAFAAGYGRRRYNAVAQAVAFRKGSKFALLKQKKGGLGLFSLRLGKRSVRSRKVWDLSRSSVRVRPHPTLALALQQMQPTYDAIYELALRNQCKRWKIAGY